MKFSIIYVLILTTLSLSIYAWNSKMFQKWIFNPYKVQQGKEYHRFITSGLIHINMIHLLVNMIVLFIFGQVLEKIYQDFRSVTWLLVLITYAGGIITANVYTYFRHRESRRYNSLGASGGVASILFATILYRPTSSVSIAGFLIPAFALGALYLLYSYFMGIRKSDNVNHAAHLFGSLFGIVFSIAIHPRVIVEFYIAIREFKLYENMIDIF